MKTIINLGELREALKDYSDDDLVVIETTAENGDTDDLYDFHIDIINNIQLVDENGDYTKTVNEIRFCQENHDM